MGSWLQPISIKVNVTRSQWEFKVKTRKLHEARGNAIVQVTVGFSSQYDWLRKWRELSRPVSARSKAKAKQSQNSFRHSEKLPNRSFKVIDARASHKPRPTNGWILKISRHALKWAVTQDLPKDLSSYILRLFCLSLSRIKSALIGPHISKCYVVWRHF